MVFPFRGDGEGKREIGVLGRGPKSDVLNGVCRVATARRSGNRGCGQEYFFRIFSGIVASDGEWKSGHKIVLDVSPANRI